MRKLVMIIGMMLLGNIYAQSSSEQVIKILNEQANAWNDGNIDDFMKYYWNSAELTFVSKRGISKGWQEVYNNYKKSYPDKKAMGILTFDNLVIEPLSPKSYMVTGSWHLQKEETAGGWFTLIFKKIKKGWFIVYDHTS